jgi:hypothetical protein
VRHFTNKFLSSRQARLQAKIQRFVAARSGRGRKTLPESGWTKFATQKPLVERTNLARMSVIQMSLPTKIGKVLEGMCDSPD